jgi:O-methyltransferase
MSVVKNVAVEADGTVKGGRSAGTDENKLWHTVGRSLRARVIRRFLDTPWRAAQYRDRFVATEMGTLYEKVEPYTMVGYGRLRGLYKAVHQVIAKGVPGDIVECGTARGGSAALMGLLLKKLDPRRRLWVFDTFEGLPAPTDEDPDYEIALHLTGACRGSIEEVTDLFERFGFSDLTVPIKGLFEDTLGKSGVGPIAVLHLDGDWYRSVKVCLDELWDKVSPGGVVQIDDYGHWAGARKAVNEFIAERSLDLKVHYLDYSGRQLVKPSLRT